MISMSKGAESLSHSAADLSVVIATRDRAGTLRRSLERLISACGGLRLEVIIVDDCSAVELGPLHVTGPHTIRVQRRGENMGVGAFNRGVEAATCSTVLVLDDDAWPADGTLERGLSIMRTEPAVGDIGLEPRHPARRRSEWAIASLTSVTHGWPLLFAGFMVRKAAWQAIGGFDAAMFLYANDTDLSLRLLDAGWDVIADPSLGVWHDSATSFFRSPRWHYLATRNRVWIARRHARGWRTLAGATLAIGEAMARTRGEPRRVWATLCGGGAGFMGAVNERYSARPASKGLRRLIAVRRGRRPAPPPELRGGSRISRLASESNTHSEIERCEQPIVAVVPVHRWDTTAEEAVKRAAREIDRCAAGAGVVVVDNGAQLDVQAVAALGPGIAVLATGENFGGAGGFNAGMRSALERSAAFVWLVDSDALAEPGCLDTLHRTLRGVRSADAACATLIDPITRRPYERGGRIGKWTGVFRSASPRAAAHGPIWVDYGAACCLLVRSSSLHALGLLPEVFINADDVAWGVRAAHTGGGVVAAPQARAIHPPPRSPGSRLGYVARNGFLALGAAHSPRIAIGIRACWQTARACAAAWAGQVDIAEAGIEGLMQARAGEFSSHLRTPVDDQESRWAFRLLAMTSVAWRGGLLSLQLMAARGRLVQAAARSFPCVQRHRSDTKER